ncbi:XdhC family protein [Salipaludibacillus agaradhaerens]|uniref:XdhC family protein n=1 Tax=Salipaludibacillus agaradhaerens TaxID=76935 RepID=A0A9Q4B3C1_SALAG|nr:XdhC family protein [Salipaludibacillus agaradhaerens]MCR6097658.1 XdhC family protein [Salipaludibacillus agaradhaerens]MCR6112858.1 XdhC family protein [Salipaludibacillus agaradhaerens]
MKDDHKFLHIMKQTPRQPFVLATITHIEGSAYRHEGAKMLFSPNGEQYGLISGGCLEDDLAYRAKEALISNQNQWITYNLQSEDDAGWGQGAGCNGTVYIYLEIIQWNTSNARVLQYLEEGRNVISVKCLLDSRVKTSFFTEEGEQLSERDMTLPKKVQLACNDLISSEKGTAFLPLDNDYLVERFEPKDNLYIFGGGRDVEPVVKKAAEFHFNVTLIDPREERCNPVNFPQASDYLCMHAEEFIATHSFKKNSYVLIMTHRFEWDQIFLQHVLDCKKSLKYAGILGPRRRTCRLLGSKEIPEWLHSPVGVDIHAEGAEEISVSIIAELIKVRNGTSKQSNATLAAI